LDQSRFVTREDRRTRDGFPEGLTLPFKIKHTSRCLTGLGISSKMGESGRKMGSSGVSLASADDRFGSLADLSARRLKARFRQQP
jgi:hypothetical protein